MPQFSALCSHLVFAGLVFAALVFTGVFFGAYRCFISLSFHALRSSPASVLSNLVIALKKDLEEKEPARRKRERHTKTGTPHENGNATRKRQRQTKTTAPQAPHENENARREPEYNTCMTRECAAQLLSAKYAAEGTAPLCMQQHFFSGMPRAKLPIFHGKK